MVAEQVLTGQENSYSHYEPSGTTKYNVTDHWVNKKIITSDHFLFGYGQL
jgi:hypothetical protein